MSREDYAFDPGPPVDITVPANILRFIGLCIVGASDRERAGYAAEVFAEDGDLNDYIFNDLAATVSDECLEVIDGALADVMEGLQ